MSKEKQILQCYASGFSQRRTADTLGVSRNTVSAVIAAAKRQHISTQAAELMDEPELILKLFPEKAFEPTQETLKSYCVQALLSVFCGMNTVMNA